MDTYNYYYIPDYINHCEIDKFAHSSDRNCSKGRRLSYSAIAVFRSRSKFTHFRPRLPFLIILHALL